MRLLSPVTAASLATPPRPRTPTHRAPTTPDAIAPAPRALRGDEPTPVEAIIPPRVLPFAAPTPVEARTVPLEQPHFSWSHSRAQLLERCERLYYEHYYGSHQGWNETAPARARLAYRLKQLTSPWSALGRAVHRRAQEVAIALMQDAPMPTLDLMRQRTREELEPLLSRHAQDPAWLRDPKRAPILRDTYYGRATRDRQQRVAAQVWERAETHLAHLALSPIWLLAQSPGARIIAADEMRSFVHEGVTTYVTPDLVLALGDGRTIIVDWKAGESDDWRDQLGLYARGLQAVYGINPAATPVELWVVHLDRNTIEAERVGADALATSQDRQDESLSRMHALLADVATNTPLAREAFQLSATPNQTCRTCKMFALCSDDLRSQGGASTTVAL